MLDAPGPDKCPSVGPDSTIVDERRRTRLMIRFDQPDRCAFCGQLIGPDEPKSGRGETAAHVACADAALGDDRFWDRIATGLGDTAAAETGTSASGRRDQPAPRSGAGDEADQSGEPGRPERAAGAERSGQSAGRRSGLGCALPALLALSAAAAVLLLPRH